MTHPARTRWRTLAAVGLALAAGCRGEEGGPTAPPADAPAVDCAAFEEVASALREGRPVPEDWTASPRRFWRGVEVCYAEGDTVCDQAFAGHRAVPSMAVVDGGPVRPPRERWVAACATLPAEAQRCLLVSHAIAHEAECRPLDPRRQLDRALGQPAH